jgi:hypothetical protein
VDLLLAGKTNPHFQTRQEESPGAVFFCLVIRLERPQRHDVVRRESAPFASR